MSLFAVPEPIAEHVAKCRSCSFYEAPAEMCRLNPGGQRVDPDEICSHHAVLDGNAVARTFT